MRATAKVSRKVLWATPVMLVLAGVVIGMNTLTTEESLAPQASVIATLHDAGRALAAYPGAAHGAAPASQLEFREHVDRLAADPGHTWLNADQLHAVTYQVTDAGPCMSAFDPATLPPTPVHWLNGEISEGHCPNSPTPDYSTH